MRERKRDRHREREGGGGVFPFVCGFVPFFSLSVQEGIIYPVEKFLNIGTYLTIACVHFVCFTQNTTLHSYSADLYNQPIKYSISSLNPSYQLFVRNISTFMHYQYCIFIRFNTCSYNHSVKLKQQQGDFHRRSNNRLRFVAVKLPNS